MATDSKSLFDVAMELQATDVPNVRQAVPFFNVKDIEVSLRFYVEGLGRAGNDLRRTSMLALNQRVGPLHSMAIRVSNSHRFA
ncbi:MAG TPA: hypothetical protein VGW76_12400 [Pyrinomonadaceae bacterium]|nr:hypothetical protein [Pyrinomonadaceae bacterium]